MKMIKRITILVMLFLMPVLALAEQGVYRDKFGNTVGTWQDNGNQRTYRNEYGNTEGTSNRDGDRRDYQDEHGNYEGSRDRDRDD